jgi:hypothetical protein
MYTKDLHMRIRRVIETGSIYKIPNARRSSTNYGYINTRKMIKENTLMLRDRACSSHEWYSIVNGQSSGQNDFLSEPEEEIVGSATVFLLGEDKL